VNRTTIKIDQESKPEIRLAVFRRTSRGLTRVPGPQELIGIVAHQCETFDIAEQPGADDRVDACLEIVRKFGQHNLGQSNHRLMTALRHPLPLMAPAVFANISGDMCGLGAVVEVVTADCRLDREGTTAE
jgi:hypothetical protein